MNPPPWFSTGAKLKGRVFPSALEALRCLETEDAFHESLIPELALFHVSDCLATSIHVNAAGQHSVAITLLRGSLEGLTLVDLGLQANEYRLPKLKKWSEGKLTAGDIRKGLARDVWPSYGEGLWNEPWSQFFGNLARALHPYAHYSPELMGWQFSLPPTYSGGRMVAILGPSTYDPLKATRITLLHALVIWTVGNLAVLSGHLNSSGSLTRGLSELRRQIGESGLLFREGDWGVELMPHVWFDRSVDWRKQA
jgi:hypothetical protein